MNSLEVLMGALNSPEWMRDSRRYCQLPDLAKETKAEKMRKGRGKAAAQECKTAAGRPPMTSILDREQIEK